MKVIRPHETATPNGPSASHQCSLEGEIIFFLKIADEAPVLRSTHMGCSHLSRGRVWFPLANRSVYLDSCSRDAAAEAIGGLRDQRADFVGSSASFCSLEIQHLPNWWGGPIQAYKL